MNFKGIFTPPVVPTFDDGSINEAQLRAYIEWLIAGGVSGIFANGSTGEFVYFSPAERQEIVRIIMDQAGKRVPVLAGVSDSNPHAVLESMEYYARLGCDAVSLCPPYYFKLGPRSVSGFLEMAVAQCPLPVFLYNIPQFANGIPRETILELCENPNVIGVKDSSRDFASFCSLIYMLRQKRPGFLLFNGTEEILAPSLLMGADGGIVATSGIVPEVTTALYAAFLSGDVENLKRIQMSLFPLIEAMLSIDFPLGFRTALVLRGFEPGPGRMSFKAHASAIKELSSRIEPILATVLKTVNA